MNLENYVAQWLEEAPALLGSVIAVLGMVGFAALLGFRHTARIDQAELERLAAAEGARLEGALIAPDAKSALARLDGGKLMVARVMGNDVSARTAPASAVRLRVARGRLSATFADLGFPGLNMQLQDSPAWLDELAGGGGKA